MYFKRLSNKDVNLANAVQRLRTFEGRKPGNFRSRHEKLSVVWRITQIHCGFERKISSYAETTGKKIFPVLIFILVAQATLYHILRRA